MSKNFWAVSLPRLTRRSTCWSQFANWSMSGCARIGSRQTLPPLLNGGLPIPAGRRGLAKQWNNLNGAGQLAVPRALATGLLFGLAIVEAMSQACDGTSA